jgi:hypothetical protein
MVEEKAGYCCNEVSKPSVQRADYTSEANTRRHKKLPTTSELFQVSYFLVAEPVDMALQTVAVSAHHWLKTAAQTADFFRPQIPLTEPASEYW